MPDKSAREKSVQPYPQPQAEKFVEPQLTVITVKQGQRGQSNGDESEDYIDCSAYDFSLPDAEEPHYIIDNAHHEPGTQTVQKN